MEAGITEAFKTFGGFGIVGAVAILAMVVSVMLYRELKETHRRWMEDRQETSDKRIEELKAHAAVIERNTSAHLEATKTNEARAITLQRLVDDHAKHDRDVETIKSTIEAIKNELQRRNVL